METAREREERRLVTALFCDLVGFTPLSERLDAEQVRAIQTRYFERMSGEIARFGGRVEKFAGDAVLALFGVPLAHGDDAERAVLCAIAMHEALQALASEIARQYGVELALRIGVNTGEAVSGMLDTGGQRDYSVTGDVVNTAARLQTAAEPGSTMAGEETMRLARKRIRFGERRDLALKGKARPVTAYQVLGPRDQVMAGSDGIPLVGRSGEIGILMGAWERASSGEGRLVTLTADAGIGKSRLIGEVVAQAGAPIIQGRALSYGQDISLALIADLIRSLLGASEQDEPERVASRLAAIVGELLVDADFDTRAAAVDVIGEVLGLPEGTSSVAGAGPQARRHVLMRSLRLLLLGLSKRGPAIVVLDDLHWIDAASAEVLGTVLADVPGLRLLVLAAHRPGWVAPWTEWPWVERLNLRPLSEREAATLAVRILGGTPLIQALEDYVAERAGGNPFFIEELLRVLRESGGIVAENGRMQLVAAAAERLPATLTEILLARLDGLDEGIRGLVQVASVIGRTFDMDLLAQVTQSATDLEAALINLLRAEIAVSVPGSRREYAFKHVSMRDVAYNTLLSSRRQALHAAVAHALIASGSDDVEIIAYHLTQTTEHDAAATWLERAGDRSADMYANQAAMTHFEEARRRLQLAGEIGPGVARVSEKLGDVFRQLAWYDEAIEELEAAQEIYREAGDLDAEARVAAEISAVHYLRGATTVAIESVRAILQRLDIDEEDPSISRGIAELYMALVDPLSAVNRFEDALTAAWRGLELARLLPDNRLNVRATVRYGIALQGIGRLDEAERVLIDVMTLAEEVGDLESLGRALAALGDIYLAQGRLEGSEAHFHRAMGVAETRGDVAAAAALLGRLGRVAFVLGRWEEARERYEQSVDLVRSISIAHFSATALMTLGEQYLRVGDVEHAARYLEEPLTIAERSGQTAQLPYLQVPLAAWDLFQGNVDEALVRLRPLLAGRSFETATDHRAMQITAEAYLTNDDNGAAEELISDGIAFAEGQSNKLALLGWLQLQGLLIVRRGGDATPHLLAALELARSIPYPYEEAQILYRIGTMSQRRDALEEALEIAQQLHATPDVTRIDEALKTMAVLDEVQLS